MLCVFYRKLVLRKFFENNEKWKKNVIRKKEIKPITYFHPITLLKMNKGKTVEERIV